MALLRSVLYLAFFTCAATTLVQRAQEQTPIGTVIDLLESLERELTRNHKDEEQTYETFACFCRDANQDKSSDAKRAGNDISRLSASIADRTQTNVERKTRKRDTQAKLERLHRELDDTLATWRKDKLQFQSDLGELSRAITGLSKALDSISDSKATIKTIEPKESLLEIRAQLVETLTLSEVVTKASASRQKALALLRSKQGVDPSAPLYDFHSDDIMSVLEKLLGEWRAQQTDMKDQFDAARKDFLKREDILRTKIMNAEETIHDLTHDIFQEEDKIAKERERLVTRQAEMQDTDLYLTDLTRMCQERAKEWDQRDSARSNEIEAVKHALDILRNDVRNADDSLVNRKVSVRSLFIQHGSSAAEASNKRPEVSGTSPKLFAAETAGMPNSLSFMQEVQEHSSRGNGPSFLSRGQLSLEDRRDQAISTLRKAGDRLGSFRLTFLATQAAAEPTYLAARGAAGDPFNKVKGLIQRLIERLLEESKSEASKKGFCDTELGKAETERDYRFTEAKKISADLESLEATRDSLTQEIKRLASQISVETTALRETTINREEDNKANQETIHTAQDGFDAVSKALIILREAYKELGKGALLVQTSASPVLEDMDRKGKHAGFSGTYHGAQDKSKAIFALLEQIEDDFDRTIRTTQAAEDAAHRDFVDFSQATKSSIAGKETKKELNEQDLSTTKIDIETKTSDMQTSVNLLDAALKELEMLKPTCIDTGMSYGDRVQARKDEIAALQDALKILQPPSSSTEEQ